MNDDDADRGQSGDDDESWLPDLPPAAIRALSEYLSERLGFELFEDEAALESAIRLVETRNLIAHNRGVVNRIYLGRVRDADLELGSTIDLGIEQFVPQVTRLTQSAFDIDGRAIGKWSLPSKPFPKELVGGDG